MRIQAIILKKTPIREHDELVMCYTRDFGKQRYQAKSSILATSKQGHHLDVLNLAEFNIIEGKQHPIIASAISVDSFPVLKSSLGAMAQAFFVLECFDKLVFENERDDKLWEYLLRTLRTGVIDQRGLIETLGYHGDTPLYDLYPSAFRSLQFLKNVVQS